MHLRATRRLQDGRFVLLGLLREGGEAVVWRALDTRDGSERALKIYPADDGGAEAAARELALARRVAHPNVVRVDDSFVEDGSAFVVMELAEGSLAERVALLGPLAPREAARALAEPLAALGAAHAAGVVHRDVKPHNLLVFSALEGRFGTDGTATVKLGDFGIAQLRAEGATRTRSGALLGSLPFLSPEQRRDPRRVGPATDVYAASVTLAWLVTGEAPGDLYLPETLAELAAKLRGRGVPEAEARWVVARVEAGGRLAAGERETLGVWAERLAGGPDDVVRGGEAEEEAEGLTPRHRETETKKGGSGSAEALAAGGGSVASKVDSWGGEGAVPPPRNAPPLGSQDSVGSASRSAWITGALVLAGLGAGAGVTGWRALPSSAGTVAGVSADARASVVATNGASTPDSLAPCEGGVGTLLPVVRQAPEETLAGAAFDLDADGVRDAVFTNQQAESLTIWWGTRGSLLVEDARQDLHAGRSASAAVLLAEGATRELLLPRADTGDLARWKVEGRTFTPLAPIPQPGSPTGAVLAHWDEDASLDLLVNTEPCLMFRPGDGRGNFPTGTCVAMQPDALARGTVTVDGRTLALLEKDATLGLYDGGADGVPHLREALPFARGAYHPGALGDGTNADLYVAGEDGSVLTRWRRRADAPRGASNAWTGCTWARGQLGGRALHAVADLDGDDVPEVLGSRTCAGCTSNQVGWRR